MTKRKTPECIPTLIRTLWGGHQNVDPNELGYVKTTTPYDHEQDAYALRRISMTLHRWHELECGDGIACIVRGRWDQERQEFIYDDAGAPYYEYSGVKGRGRYSRIADKETGARKRLARIMSRYPSLSAYIQTDPRGCALYILRPGDVRDGQDASCCYSNGIAVYQ